MAIGDLLGNSVSALLTFQRALATTSHNIANVNTEGYSVQRAELVSRPTSGSAAGFIGNGVDIATVKRMRDQFLEVEIRSNTSTFEYFDMLYGFARRVESVLGDPDTGLNQTFNDFFSAVETVANDPSSLAARSAMVGSGQMLVGQFHLLHQALQSIGSELNGELRNVVSEINSFGNSIAKINRDIVFAQSRASNQPPNDLLDKRDQLILELSKLVDVSTVALDDGSVSVSVGNGQSLVLGFESQPLSVTNNPLDPSRLEMTVGFGTEITESLTGGRIGGLLGFRDQMLDPAFNGLGRVAIGLAETFNQQHQLGQDLDGVLGQVFFNTAGPELLPHPQNTTASGPTVTITDVGQLTVSDYLLRFDGAVWSLTRQSNGQPVSMSGTGTDADPFVADGLSISVQALGAVAGDDYRFLVRPTRAVAGQITQAITDPDRIAAASPVRGESVSANLGTGAISNVIVTDTTSIPLSSNGGDITLTFDPDAMGAGVPGFVVAGGPGGTLAYDPATESAGKTFVLAPPFGGLSFTISGIPVAGDYFVLQDNINGVGDNRNVLMLAELRDALTLSNGSASYQDAYIQLVGDSGLMTRQTEISRDTQQSARDFILETRESFSGVNLDEEAADLLRYQQAYQASARVIVVANEIFQELLAAVRG